MPRAIGNDRRSMGRLTAAAAVGAALLFAAAPGATGARRAPLVAHDGHSAARIGHAGRWITDAAGRAMVLHGLNMVYKLPPYYPAAAGFGADDAALLQRLGLNVVRVGVIWKAVEPQPGVYDDAYLKRIAATVRTLARHRVLSLLDFHQDMYNEVFQGEGAPDWAVQDDGLPNPKNGFPTNYFTNPALERANDHFWDNSRGPGGVGLQDRYAGAWRHVARKFRTVSGVLGYELFNEPAPGAQFLSCLGSCPSFDAQLTAFNRRVAKAIRTVDRRTLIFYEPNIGFDFGAPSQVGALAHGPAGFAFHDYCLTASPEGCASEPKGFANALAHVARTREALILTEFGSNLFSHDLNGMVGLADRLGVPWTEWAYCPCNDPTGSTPDPLVLDPAKPPVGANLGQLALQALVEPFPHLISGTPLTWGYDRNTGVFHLRYSTVKANGHGRFRAGAVSAIATPHLVYAMPYAVHVRGGAIVSRRGAGVLQIAACRGVHRISVTVLRSGRNRQSCAVATGHAVSGRQRPALAVSAGRPRGDVVRRPDLSA